MVDNVSERWIAAQRMRLHRSRRRAGMRCLTIALHVTEVEALVRKGLLSPERQHDDEAIRAALRVLIGRALGEERDA